MHIISSIKLFCFHQCRKPFKFPARQITVGIGLTFVKLGWPEKSPKVIHSVAGFQGRKGSSGKPGSVKKCKEGISAGPKEFVIDTFGNNPAFPIEFGKDRIKAKSSSTSILTFSGIDGLRQDVIDSINSLSISQPTVIQLKSIPLILKGKNVLCAAQTGSGKTLAYLVPILNTLKNEEERGWMTRFYHPRVCIIAPFRELAAQILQVVKQLSYQVPFRSIGCIGGEKDRIMYRALREKPVDILVGTPGTVVDLLTRSKISFSNLKFMVFDEVDTMYDASFKGITNELLKSAQSNAGDQSKEGDCKFLFAAATLPKHGVLNHIKDSIKDIVVVTANLHQVLPNIRYHFIKVLQPEKPGELLRVLDSRISINSKVIIFANTSSTCNWLSKYLSEKEISHVKFSGKTSPEERQKILNEFRNKDNGIIVSTDLASRGLDFPDLCHVINYDCPLNTTDFIHRAGRTGRARAEYVGTPVVYTLLSRNWEVSLARKVQFAAEKKKAISDVNIIKRGQDIMQEIEK